MRILITGGAGFIGSHVVDAYLEAGHDVAVLDDLSRGLENNVNPRARFYLGDIQDRACIESVLDREKPEVVNHHAAQMDVRRGVREPVFDATVNILGSLHLLEAAVKHGIRRFVYVSTAGAAYGEPQALPVAEDHPINPVTPYGISKHTVEHYLYTFSHLYGLAYVVLRYGNIYGQRQSSQGEAGVFAIFCEQILAAVRPVIYGDGSKVRDYVYINDVARANLAALERGDGEIFNIGTGVATTDYAVFCLVRDLLGESHLEPTYTAKRPGEIERICLDISKARRLLEWVPVISLEEGARRTVRFFQSTPESRSAGAAVASQPYRPL
ncbi:MAG: NAD-dependent epimerase/dehydratase family protein [Acidobacteria bacterium]|nr:NAD-dependent epimerase/dehydratase family protein [Acidobacteriota bacterium]